MKKTVKWIVAGFIVILVGAAVLMIGLAVNGWKFHSSVRFETKSFAAESEITSLRLNIDAGSVVTEFYDGDKITVDYPISEDAAYYTMTFTERNGVLTVIGKLKWYAVFGFSTDIPQTVIHLPRDVVFDVNADLDAGSITLGNGTYGTVNVSLDAGMFEAEEIICKSFLCDIDAGKVIVASVVCDSMSCEIDAGTVNIGKATCKTTRIDIDAGTLILGFTDEKEQFTITRKVSAGSCNVSAQTGTTDKTIRIEVDAGSVNLTFGVA